MNSSAESDRNNFASPEKQEQLEHETMLKLVKNHPRKKQLDQILAALKLMLGQSSSSTEKLQNLKGKCTAFQANEIIEDLNQKLYPD